MLGRWMPCLLFLSLWLPACDKPADPVSSSGDSAVARVNGAMITVDDFHQKWSQLPQAVRAAYTGTNGKKDFLGELITRELLLQKARAMNLDRDKTLEERATDYRERLILDAVLRELIEKKIEVSEEELTAYFNDHRDALPLIEEVRAAHILVDTEAEAEAILKKLRRGAKFETLARTLSIDPGSRDKGGDLGTVRKGRTLPEFEAAVFRLKPGRIGDPVKTPHGYHIIRVQGRQTRKPLTVDDVREEIQRQIVKEKETALFENTVHALKSESTIVISDPLLASIGDNVIPSHDPAPAARP